MRAHLLFASFLATCIDRWDCNTTYAWQRAEGSYGPNLNSRRRQLTKRLHYLDQTTLGRMVMRHLLGESDKILPKFPTKMTLGIPSPDHPPCPAASWVSRHQYPVPRRGRRHAGWLEIFVEDTKEFLLDGPRLRVVERFQVQWERGHGSSMLLYYFRILVLILFSAA